MDLLGSPTAGRRLIFEGRKRQSSEGREYCDVTMTSCLPEASQGISGQAHLSERQTVGHVSCRESIAAAHAPAKAAIPYQLAEEREQTLYSEKAAQLCRAYLKNRVLCQT
jgi:hypothetical protein